jgi:DNA-binding SARP family transcriptional activator
MTALTIHLFGRVAFERECSQIISVHSNKVQELFCYLLLQPERPHAREVLASMLWGDCATAQSRKYLRQALWQLQCAFGAGCEGSEDKLLITDTDSVRIDPKADLWLDVKLFEQAFAEAQSTPGDELTEHQANLLRGAVQLYRGELLEGWYQDWCLFQRERLQNHYLAMLDKLMAYCEEHSMYGAGLEYGERVLVLDRAHERTHRNMVKLLYLAGDRAGALRQYDRCVSALAEELNVKPATKTLQLYEQIRADKLDASCVAATPLPPARAEDFAGMPAQSQLPAILESLHSLEEMLADAHKRAQQNIQVVERLIHRRPAISLSHKRRAI